MCDLFLIKSEVNWTQCCALINRIVEDEKREINEVQYSLIGDGHVKTVAVA